MREKLSLPRKLDGHLWLHSFQGPVRRMHSHEELEINLAVRGRAAYLVKDKRYDLMPQSLLWLFPDQEHLLIEQSPDFQMWILVFRRRLVQQVTKRTEETDYHTLRQRDPEGNLCVALGKAQYQALQQLYIALREQAGETALLNSGLAYALLASWHAFTQTENHPPVRQVHPAIEQTAHLLHDAPGDFDLAGLAARVGLSPSRLSRVFRRQMGLTLVGYRQRCCLERFFEGFARQPQHKILALALQAGFGSYPQFHRVFRQLMGQSPAEFLRRSE